MPAQWRLLAEKIIRHRAGSSRDTRVPLSLGNQSQPCTQAELLPAQLEMTAVSLHLGRGGGVVSPGPALSGTCCLTDTRANSCVLPMDLNQHPQLSPGKKILHQSPVEEAEFWALRARNWRRLGGCCEGASRPVHPFTFQEWKGGTGTCRLSRQSCLHTMEFLFLGIVALPDPAASRGFAGTPCLLLGSSTSDSWVPPSTLCPQGGFGILAHSISTFILTFRITRMFCPSQPSTAWIPRGWIILYIQCCK